MAIENGHVCCPDCKTWINVGKVGLQNYYKRHKNSAQCAVNRKKKKIEDTIQKTKQNALKFFRPKPPAIPPTVKTPAPVYPYASSSINPPSTFAPSLGGKFLKGQSPTQAPVGCPIGIDLLRKLRLRVEALPPDVGTADENHPLAAFSGNPEGCVGKDEDAWEMFDGPLNTLLQKPQEELRSLVRVGEKGLIGLCRLLEYLVVRQNVSGALLEGKVGRLIQAIDEV